MQIQEQVDEPTSNSDILAQSEVAELPAPEKTIQLNFDFGLHNYQARTQ